jgi:NAD(P)H-dependent flavin oxidoreductase YrpB (nitropropane dioxygenase family)
MRTRLKTPLCDVLGIEVPIITAGMAEAAGVDLAIAVSNAGGLGVMGCTMDSPDELREKIRAVRRGTDRSFGVDLLLPPNVSLEMIKNEDLLDQIPKAHREYREELRKKFNVAQLADGDHHVLGTGALEQLEVLFEEKVPVFVSGLGSPGFMMERARAQGMKVMGVVGNVKNAKRVASAGVDAVVAQGGEGGGHTGTVGTFALLPQVVDAVSPMPVVAAGSISDGRGLAAALVFGCQAVWVGTRFLASNEASIAQWKKEAIVSATDESTVRSRSYTGKPARLIKNAWTEQWEKGGVEPLPMPLQGALISPLMNAIENRPDIQANAAGQGVGLIHEIKPAAAIVEDMVRDAEAVLARLGRVESKGVLV